MTESEENKNKAGEVQYSFTPQSMNFSGLGVGQGQYSFHGENLSLSVNPGETRQRPRIGPEIGPDPRSASARVRMTEHPNYLDEASGVRYDFHHGYRLETPTADGIYHLRVYDLDSEMLLEEIDLKAGQMAVGPRKYYIRYRLSLEKDNTLIFQHDYDCSGREVMIIIPDGGLGDNLAWLPYVDAFRKEHEAKVTCVCGEWLIRIIRDRYPELTFIPVVDQPTSEGYYACYFCAIFPKDRKNWRPSDHQNFGMQGSVAKILGVTFEPRKVNLKLDAPRPFSEPYVCISAMATNPAKYWNYEGGWNALCRYLKRLGFRVLVIDRDHDLYFAGKHYSVPEEAEDWTGLKPISERIDLLQHAEFFIGLPSGLSWLAWNCNVPVVMLAGFTLDGSEFPTPYRVTNFNFCHGCWNDSELFFDMHVPVWCPRHVGTAREIECTRAITPKMVIDTVNRIPCVRERIASARAGTPLLSVIMTTCRGNFLPDTLASIARAMDPSGVKYEILIYDDATPSAESKIRLDRLASEYPDLVRLYHGETNVGAALGRNAAIAHARGKYLMIFDDDDIMLPFDVKAALEFLEDHPEIPASYAQKYLFSAEKGYLREIHGSVHSLFSAFYAPKININAMLIRTEAFQKTGGFQPIGGDKTITGEDVLLMIRLGLTGELHFDRVPRSLYRIHAAQITAPKPPWSNLITQQPCIEHKELYDRILRGDIPDTHGPDFRLVRGLMGAAAFFHQRERKITDPILETGLREFRDDFGLWDIYLTFLCMDRKKDELLRVYPEALEIFKDEPSVCYTLLGHVVTMFRLFREPIPEDLRQKILAVQEAYLTPPEIVTEELKRMGL